MADPVDPPTPQPFETHYVARSSLGWLTEPLIDSVQAVSSPPSTEGRVCPADAELCADPRCATACKSTPWAVPSLPDPPSDEQLEVYASRQADARIVAEAEVERLRAEIERLRAVPSLPVPDPPDDELLDTIADHWPIHDWRPYEDRSQMAQNAIDALAAAGYVVVKAEPDMPKIAQFLANQQLLNGLADEGYVMVKADGLPQGARLRAVDVAGYDDDEDIWTEVYDLNTGDVIQGRLWRVLTDKEPQTAADERAHEAVSAERGDDVSWRLANEKDSGYRG